MTDCILTFISEFCIEMHRVYYEISSSFQKICMKQSANSPWRASWLQDEQTLETSLRRRLLLQPCTLLLKPYFIHKNFPE